MRTKRLGPHVANRFFEHVNLQKAASALLVDGVAVTLQAGTGLLLMAFYHPYLLAFGLALSLAVAALLVLPWRRGLATAYDESSAKYAIGEWLEELSRVPQAFQGRAAAHWASEQAELRVRTWLKARSAHFRVSFGQMAGALVLHAVASTLLLAVGGAVVMRVVAEVDDSALLKALASEGHGVVAAPVVVAGELEALYGLELLGQLNVREAYYALTLHQRLDHPAVEAMLVQPL
ncbi:MAG: hypothetical protein JNK82_33840 [Myxococcaceae bacterium]|nr:hypothetical protein [Myxococcaceae bacterium]